MPYTPYKGLTYNDSRGKIFDYDVNKLNIKQIENLLNLLKNDYDQAISPKWYAPYFNSVNIPGYKSSLVTDSYLKEKYNELLNRQAQLNNTTVGNKQPTVAPINSSNTTPKTTLSNPVVPSVKSPVKSPSLNVNKAIGSTPTTPVNTAKVNPFIQYPISPEAKVNIDSLYNKLIGNNKVNPYLNSNGTIGNSNVSIAKPLPNINDLPPIPTLATPTINPTNTGVDNTDKTDNPFLNTIKKIGSNLPTFGDMLSAYGTYKGMRDAEKLTLENRAKDTPNENFYKNYGQRALSELDDNNQYIDRLGNEHKQELLRQQALNNKLIQSNVLGSGVQQALQQNSYASTLDNINKLNSSLDQNKLAILSQKANLLNQIDQIVMQGEAQRDLADRQDNDAFYSNLSQNKMDYARGLQHLGGMLNNHKLNNTKMNLLKQLSMYGFALDSNGNLYKTTP